MFTNANVPYGLNPVRMGGSGYYTGGVNIYRVPASNTADMACGDPVATTGEGDGRMVADVTLVAPGDTRITGVIIGTRPETTRDQDRLVLAGKERYVLVADDPGIECLIRANGVVTPAMVGQNIDFAVGTPDPLYGTSGITADVGTVGIVATLPMKIVGMYDVPDNQLLDEAGNAAPNPLLRVRLNTSDFSRGTVGV